MTDPEWKAAYEAADATREAARALVRARHAAGLTQTELARRSGTAQAVISRIECGTVSPSLDTLTRIAKGLGMRPVVALEPLPGKQGRRWVLEKKEAVLGKGPRPKRPPGKSTTGKGDRGLRQGSP